MIKKRRLTLPRLGATVNDTGVRYGIGCGRRTRASAESREGHLNKLVNTMPSFSSNSENAPHLAQRCVCQHGEKRDPQLPTEKCVNSSLVHNFSPLNRPGDRKSNRHHILRQRQCLLHQGGAYLTKAHKNQSLPSFSYALCPLREWGRCADFTKTEATNQRFVKIVNILRRYHPYQSRPLT